MNRYMNKKIDNNDENKSANKKKKSIGITECANKEIENYNDMKVRIRRW